MIKRQRPSPAAIAIWFWVTLNLIVLWLSSLPGIWYTGKPSVFGITVIRRLFGANAADMINSIAAKLLRLLS